jgi:hypothetical protein
MGKALECWGLMEQSLLRRRQDQRKVQTQGMEVHQNVLAVENLYTWQSKCWELD